MLAWALWRLDRAVSLGVVDRLYAMRFGSVHAAVVVRDDTVIEAPPTLKAYVGRSIGPLLYWVAHQPFGSWVAVPYEEKHRVYERQLEQSEQAPEPPRTHVPLTL